MPHVFTKGVYLTTAEAAALLDVSPATLKRWAQSGLIPSERTEGGHRRFRAEDVKALSQPPGQGGDPVRQGADLVAAAGSVLALQTWLLEARRELGSWWSVARPLRGVVAELYRRRSAGQLGAVALEVAQDRLRSALLRFLDGVVPPPAAPRLLVAAAPGDPFLVAAALAQLCAAEAGWQAVWIGHPAAAALEEELAAHPAAAVAVFGSPGVSTEALMAHAEALEEVARRRRVPMALAGLGDWPAPGEGLRRLGTGDEVKGWLDDQSAALARRAAAPAPASPASSAAPPGLAWDPTLALGHPVVDAQHETLFRHVADFAAAVRRGEAAPELPELLAFITDYARIHFRYEEGLMREVGFPGLAEHQLEHVALTERLGGLVLALGAPPAPAEVEALEAFLLAWLRGHVAGSDQRIAEHLRRRAAGPG